MYFGGAIMTFALPYGAFIAAAVALFYLFRARHSAPRLRWSSATAPVTSVITREPGPAPAPAPTTGVSAATAIPVPAAAVPEATAPAPAHDGPASDSPANDGPASDSPPNDGPASDNPPNDDPEGKDGEPG
jgi:hypothetical protein